MKKQIAIPPVSDINMHITYIIIHYFRLQIVGVVSSSICYGYTIDLWCVSLTPNRRVSGSIHDHVENFSILISIEVIETVEKNKF